MLHFDFSYSDMEFFLVILVRTTAFFYVAQFFDMGHVPMRVRLGLSFVVSMLLYGTLLPHDELLYRNEIEYAFLVAKEFVVGILMGMGVNMCTSILGMTGAIADMEVGFSMVSVMDPVTNNNTTITSSFYQYMITMILIISGMYEYIVQALAEAYQLIPINGAVFDADNLLNGVVAFLTDYVRIGFQIALPIFSAILLLDVVLGIMAKVSPQMNMFAVGLQLKVFCGLGVILLTIGLLPDMSDLIFTEIRKMTVTFVEAIAPS
ncbi:MAG: flagellar biosynthetic protein FliR [Lachnospiraceae bacterium]|nr:flagellar biosynthetic protein FliR [Lachnospiraceae bacterium]